MANREKPPSGNVYDKYGTANPVARLLMRGFLQAYGDLVRLPEHPARALEVGTGEGELLSRLAEIHPLSRAVALDLDPGVVREAASRVPSASLLVADAARLPFAPRSFDLVVSCETLEHLPDPGAALGEIRRVLVPGGALLASVPREPLWRALNVLRGAYLSRLGNTPGHLQHFGRGGFLRLLSAHGFRVEAVRSPLPWTMARARA